MRKYTTLAASAVLLAACGTYDPLGDARQTATNAGFVNPDCGHAYLPNKLAKRPGDAKGQFCSDASGRTAFVSGKTITETR